MAANLYEGPLGPAAVRRLLPYLSGSWRAPVARFRVPKPWCWASLRPRLVRRSHTVGIFFLTALIISAVCLARASPPDPTWIPGIYDNADYDDVIGLLTDTSAVRKLPLVALDSVCLVLWFVPGGPASVVPDASLLGFRFRSPPTN